MQESAPRGYHPAVRPWSLHTPIQHLDATAERRLPGDVAPVHPGLAWGEIMNQAPDPGYIMQTATAFWASKVLLTAVEMGVFTPLAGPTSAAIAYK